MKSNSEVVIINPKTWEITQTLKSPGGTSLWGMAVDRDERLYTTNAEGAVHVFARKTPDDPLAPYLLER